MKALNRGNVAAAKSYTNRIIQFGEGNFLRAFVDWMVQEMNNKLGFDAGVTLVQPIEQGMVDLINDQDGLYHLVLKGLDNGQPVRTIDRIDVINNGLNPYADFAAYIALADDLNNRFIISNTTEAGIAFNEADRFEDAPAKSFPGKLTQLLYRRFEVCKGAKESGFIIIPCELIDRNGDNLLRCIKQYIALWGLSTEFAAWVCDANYFCNTLVDRIVPGFPRETIGEIQAEIGYKDNLVVEGEVFHLWVIEGEEVVRKEFPADKAGLNVLFVPSMKPYRDRKVVLLNGPHTVLSPVGYLNGLNTVRECVEDVTVGRFVRQAMFEELLSSLDLPKAELEQFASDVVDRFRNPYVHHLVTSIMLNSFPKYKTRDLPAVKIYLERKGTLPKALVLGLAAIAVYYKGGKRGDDQIVPNDDKAILDLLAALWATESPAAVAKGIVEAEFIWGENLATISGLEALLAELIELILGKGMNATIESVVA